MSGLNIFDHSMLRMTGVSSTGRVSPVSCSVSEKPLDLAHKSSTLCVSFRTVQCLSQAIREASVQLEFSYSPKVYSLPNVKLQLTHLTIFFFLLWFDCLSPSRCISRINAS